MVRETTINGLSVVDALKVRCDAERLLKRLLLERQISEERCQENGEDDPIKQVTGASAIDLAIQEAREILKHLDKVLAPEAEGKRSEERPIVATVARRLLGVHTKAAVGAGQ